MSPTRNNPVCSAGLPGFNSLIVNGPTGLPFCMLTHLLVSCCVSVPLSSTRHALHAAHANTRNFQRTRSFCVRVRTLTTPPTPVFFGTSVHRESPMSASEKQSSGCIPQFETNRTFRAANDRDLFCRRKVDCREGSRRHQWRRDHHVFRYCWWRR